ESIKSLHGDEADLRKEGGMLAGVELLGQGTHPWEMNWRQPSIAVNAFQASSRKHARNIISESAWARLGVRLVPNLDPKDVQKRLVDALKKSAPWGLEVEVHADDAAGWGYTGSSHPAVQAALRAPKKGYGAGPGAMRCGGRSPLLQPVT